VTEGHTELAAVDDVLLDKDGDVVGFALNKIQIKGPLAERKTIARTAISTVGSKTAAMTTDLAQAESAPIPAN
jgi:hypothetical protein